MAKATGNKAGDLSLHKALAHPLRERLLRALIAQGVLSAARFSEASKESDWEVSLSLAAYHLRVLEKYGVVNVWKTIQRRGAYEHLFVVDPNSPVPDMMRAGDLLRQLRVCEDALNLDGDDMALSLSAIEADARGLKELSGLIVEFESRVTEIGEKNKRRLDVSTEPPTLARVALASYSPQSTPLEAPAIAP